MKTVQELLKIEPEKLTVAERKVVKKYHEAKDYRHSGGFITHAKNIPPEPTKKKEDNGFVEIRCPFNRRLKDGNMVRCNWRIVSVSVGSKGEAYCVRCKKPFEFEANSQGDYNPTVRAQHE